MTNFSTAMACFGLVIGLVIALLLALELGPVLGVEGTPMGTSELSGSI